MQIIFQYDLKNDEVLFLKARDLGETSVIKAEDLFVRLRRDGIIEETIYGIAECTYGI